MIDLHCHIVPGIDDGSESLEMSLKMAQMAAADGTTTLACTPHIMPGVYNNYGRLIKAAVVVLQSALQAAQIPLKLVAGADVHVSPDVLAGLKEGRILTLNDSRYFLLEPPHDVVLPRLADHISGLHAAGYVAILTHPERLSWIEGHYSLIKRLVRNGTLMQVTAGSLLGKFGRRPRYWAERMLDEGICHLLASDGHNDEGRPPCLTKGRDAAARRVGREEAANLVYYRPLAIIHNASPRQLPPLKRGEPVSEPLRIWENVLARAKVAGVRG